MITKLMKNSKSPDFSSISIEKSKRENGMRGIKRGNRHRKTETGKEETETVHKIDHVHRYYLWSVFLFTRVGLSKELSKVIFFHFFKINYCCCPGRFSPSILIHQIFFLKVAISGCQSGRSFNYRIWRCKKMLEKNVLTE